MDVGVNKSTSHTVYGPRYATWWPYFSANLIGMSMKWMDHLSTTSRCGHKANGTWSRAPSYF
ncbi:unnamed protein product [Brassica rapa]|uniref:Uncharacterized protein n=1 Tax=Brassica campestris TaxID=3711 RepID=A0A8D9DT96_BRACM|nr:unnamed protein product [Brassica rapa]